MKTLLVTGLGGFVGPWVRAHAAREQRWSVAGLPEQVDLRDPGTLEHALAQQPPDAVIHLAARSHVPDSFADPRGTLETNTLGTLALLQALAKRGFRGRFVYVSSGDVYGLVAPELLPVDEQTPPKPRNPYAVSKLAAEHLCLQWHYTEGLDAVVVRPFNHIGPGQSERFVVATLAAQVARIAAGGAPPVIEAGDLEVTRDFTDVRDVVAAYFALLEGGTAGEVYNVASGRETRVADILGALGALARVDVEVRTDAGRMRRAEQRRMRASADKLERATGWQRSIPLERSLHDILQYFKDRSSP